jgi:hypothetical protein
LRGNAAWNSFSGLGENEKNKRFENWRARHCQTDAGLPDGIHIFKPKSQFGLSLEGLEHNRIYWYNLRPFGQFYGHLVHFVVIWYIVLLFSRFGTYVVPKNLATLD